MNAFLSYKEDAGVSAGTWRGADPWGGLTRAEEGLWHWGLSRGECPWGLNPVSGCYRGDMGQQAM